MPATLDLSSPFARSFRYENDKTFCPPRLDQGFDELLAKLDVLRERIVALETQRPRLTIYPEQHPTPRAMDGRIRNGWLEVYSEAESAWVAAGVDTIGPVVTPAILPTISYEVAPHANAAVGDRWRDPASGTWYDFIPGNVWVGQAAAIGTAPPPQTYYPQETPPDNPQPGWTWFKPSTGQQFDWENGAWIEDQ